MYFKGKKKFQYIDVIGFNSFYKYPILCSNYNKCNSFSALVKTFKILFNISACVCWNWALRWHGHILILKIHIFILLKEVNGWVKKSL